MSSDDSFVVKTLSDKRHECQRDMHNKQATTQWIASEYLDQFRRRPDMNIKELGSDIMEKFSTEASIWKLYRARKEAKKILTGTIEEHYARLRSYVAELKRVDPDGRFELHLDLGSVFKSFYVGFSALKKGFIEGCRSFIGFDGCFLKAGVGGMLLTAVGKDGNNQMFPVAWAVVNVENQANWTWFLSILFQELGIGDGGGWTFISDQQKGLLNVVADLTPHVEYRNCARHILMNLKKRFKCSSLETVFWKAAKSTYIQQYKLALDDMAALDKAAHDDFVRREPVRFCQAFMSTRSKCDSTSNNISETFNNYILKARGKPIIDMLEEIRCQLMMRQYDKFKSIDASQKLCPTIKAKLEELKFENRMCSCRGGMNMIFQVQHNDDRFVVSIKEKSCTCRSWDISGIPCIHACSAITFLKKDHQDYVADCYTMQKYKKSYTYGIPPLNGHKMWPPPIGYPVKPPNHTVMPGRPKKNRRNAIEEKECKGRTKLPRSGIQMTCQKCLQQGHNKKTCKNPEVIKPPKPAVKRGRPFKNSSETEEGQSSSIQTKSQNAQQPHRTQSHQVFIERAQARQGFGVFVGHSGNSYVRTSTNKKIRQVNSAYDVGSGSRSQDVATEKGRGGRGRGAGQRGGASGHRDVVGTQECYN